MDESVSASADLRLQADHDGSHQPRHLGAVPTCDLTTHVAVCWPDQTSAGGVTEITAGNGLAATPTNPITSTGTLAVDAPVCSATTEKLLWDGSAFQCGVDQQTLVRVLSRV